MVLTEHMLLFHVARSAQLTSEPFARAFVAWATIMSRAILLIVGLSLCFSPAPGLVMGTTPPRTKVCVTGANGYVATELVSQLLDKGYHVHGTVRSLSKPDRYAFLKRLAERANAPLQLFEADLMVPGSFDAAVEGCKYVFHVASPVIYNTTDPEKDLVRPAVEGVTNVLESVARAKAKTGSPFRRLVLTSTSGAIFGVGSKPKNGKLFTDQDWNEVSSLDNWPYFYSKVLAERRGWELAQQHELDMVVVNPSYVWGPPAAPELVSTLNLQRIAGILSGKQTPWTFDFPACDSRDVASVHILAAETAGAKGRYIVSTPKTVSPKWFASTMAQHYPGRFANMQKADDAIEGKPLLDTSKTQEELGIQLRSSEETATDTVQSLLDGGHIEGEQ